MIRPDLSPELADALASGAPVVALESTIVSHGMPWPRNAEVARAVEDRVRASGAVPATAAVVDGRLRLGIDDAALERLGRGAGVTKASTRDLGAVLAAGGTAGTTVSATMRIAALAGVSVFATGGIGGVHRDGVDVSADLTELGRTEVLVVSAGAKSILDIPATLERLETARVPVVVRGADAVPAFHARDSGLPAPLRLDAPEAIARVWRMHRACGAGTGMLVANPIPEAHAVPRDAMDAAVADALAAAERTGVAGPAITPFLLARINEAVPEMLEANVALVLSNAALAAAIAAAG